MKVIRKIIAIDDELCDGCGLCIPACAEGSLKIVDGKARVVSDNLCDGLGACLGECPNGALQIVEREAEEFDEEAVEAHLARRDDSPASDSGACGCPSAQVQVLAPADAPGIAPPPETGASALTHWPVQIHLVPPEAPFLKGADLLVLADCCAVAVPRLHDDLLRGRVVLLGCPKFDDAEAYVEKFRRIFERAGLRSVTTVAMEVPCCSSLAVIVGRALEASGLQIPFEQRVVRIRDGEVQPADEVPSPLDRADGPRQR